MNALIVYIDHINDCREEWVSLPGGFTKTGSPLLVFPDKAQFNYLHVTDLHTLLQYYINVVPRSEQVSMLPALYTGCCKTTGKLWQHITETLYGFFLVF